MVITKPLPSHAFLPLQSFWPLLQALSPGSVAFHHGLTVHMARANRSSRVRRVHTMIYFRDGATRSQPYVHPSVDRPGIKVGEPIASELTPIVWPRDDTCPSRRGCH